MLTTIAVLAMTSSTDARQSLQRRPTFRSGVSLTYVNVVVRDKDGNIVRGLTKDDFTILEDDKTQTITTFDFENVPSEAIPAEQQVEPVAPILQTTPVKKADANVPAAARAAAAGGATRPQESPADRAAVRRELDAT